MSETLKIMQCTVFQQGSIDCIYQNDPWKFSFYGTRGEVIDCIFVNFPGDSPTWEDLETPDLIQFTFTDELTEA